MKHITFVTTNKIKFDSAKALAGKLGFSIDQAALDFIELQENSEVIARHKAEQAYAKLGKPVVITDDEWIIPGLNGFPGAYMKQMNEWFGPSDWLNATKDLQDRRIILRQHAVYQDAAGQQYFVDDIVGTLLPEVRGSSHYAHITITSFDGGHRSRAEALASGQPLLPENTPTVWHKLADWLTRPEN